MWHGLKLTPQLGHASCVSSIALSVGGDTIVSSGRDDVIKVWDSSSGRLLRTLDGHAGYNRPLAVSQDGRTVAGGDDKVVKLRDATTGSTIVILEGHDKPVVSVSLSHDGRTVVSGSEDNTIKIWDVASGRLVRTLLGHAKYVGSVALSDDGLHVVSGSGDATVKFWDMGSGQLLRTYEGHTASVRTVALSSEHRIVVSSSYDNTIRICDLHSGKLLNTIDAGRSGPAALSANGCTVLWSRSDRYPSYPIQVWDTLQNTLIRSLEGHHDQCVVVPSADGRILVSGSADCTIKVWDATTGQLLRAMQGQRQGAIAVALSPDKRTIVSAGEDSIMRVWDATTGRLRHALVNYEVCSVALSADGRTIMSGSRGSWSRSTEDYFTPKLTVWDASSGELLLTIEGNTNAVLHAVAMSPDGCYVIAGSDGWIERDNKTKIPPALQVWDAANGKLLHTLLGHERAVHSISVTPDSRTIVSGDGGPAIRWDIVTGQRLACDPSDEAFLAAGKTPPSIFCAGPAICLLAKDGSVRARFITLPGSHWISIADDERTYTASDGAEVFLLLVEDGTNTPSELNAGFVAAHRRDSLDLGPWPGEQSRFL